MLYLYDNSSFTFIFFTKRFNILILSYFRQKLFNNHYRVKKKYGLIKRKLKYSTTMYCL